MEKTGLSTILFDLDGTLLPMDQQQVMYAYLKLFRQKCRSIDLDPDRATDALMTGLQAMGAHDGSQTNEQVFWSWFSRVMQIPIDDQVASFIRFYTEEFTQIKAVVDPTPLAAQIVQTVRQKGYCTVLATTPVFPRAGTLERMRWADLEPQWFELITTYEDFSHTKPSLLYYQDILDRLNVSADACLMIGNDVAEDLVVSDMGMEVFLVTDNLINRQQQGIDDIPQGSLTDLLDFCHRLEAVGP